MGPIVGLRELISMLKRRAPLIALIMTTGIVLTLGYAASLPRSYEASTLIQLQPSAMQATADGSLPRDTPARLRLIEQRVMTRQNVLDMIERHHLFEDAPQMSEADRIWRFRQDVRLTVIASAGSQPGMESGVSAMLVTANTGSPTAAAALANDIADQIVSGNRDVVARRLGELVSALNREDQRLLAQLGELQDAIETQRRAEGDALPENLTVLQGEMTTLQGQRVETVRSIQALERERLMIEVSGDESEGGAPEISLTEQIGRLRVDLARARRRLGENHPEVERLEASIDALQQGNVRNLSPGVQRQVELIDEQLATLEDERAALDARRAELDAAITRMPEVAQRLDGLNRRLAGIETQREAVAARLAAARLDANLISDEHGERMVILERAIAPEQPQSSSRRRIAVLGLAASIGAALVAALLMEFARPVLRSPRQLQAALGVGAIAVARRLPTPAERAAGLARLAVTVAILAAGAWYSWRLIAPPVA